MTILLYCALIAFASMVGGYLPLAGRIPHVRLQVYLSLSAGAMLGAAFFHMLPEAAEQAPRQFGTWLACGVIGLYMIERFLSPHSHEAPDGDEDPHAHAHAEHEPHCDHSHSHEAPAPQHSAAPKVAGWSAVVGLFIHTILGGVALGSAVLAADAPRDLGLAVFLATLLHKPADSLTISTLLLKGGTARRRAFWVQIVFASLIPLGVVLFHLWRSTFATAAGPFTGRVLAFSAGTFICIALSDLLPEVQFHSHDRVKLFLAVLTGAALMWATALIESASHAH